MMRGEQSRRGEQSPSQTTPQLEESDSSEEDSDDSQSSPERPSPTQFISTMRGSNLIILKPHRFSDHSPQSDSSSSSSDSEITEDSENSLEETEEETYIYDPSHSIHPEIVASFDPLFHQFM